MGVLCGIVALTTTMSKSACEQRKKRVSLKFFLLKETQKLIFFLNLNKIFY